MKDIAAGQPDGAAVPVIRSVTQGTVLPAASLGELRDWCRISAGQDNVLLAQCLMSATVMAESDLRAALVARRIVEVQPVSSQWQALAIQPVLQVLAVQGLPAEGADFTLAPDSYAFDIDRQGDGRLRVMRPGAAGRVRVIYQAGMAEEAGSLPAALWQGVLMLAAHLYRLREGEDCTILPQAVALLWQPWRRLRLA